MKYLVSFTVSTVVESDNEMDAFAQAYALIAENRYGGEIVESTMQLVEEDEE